MEGRGCAEDEWAGSGGGGRDRRFALKFLAPAAGPVNSPESFKSIRVDAKLMLSDTAHLLGGIACKRRLEIPYKKEWRLQRPSGPRNLMGMPELPDIATYISALETRIVGQPLLKVRIAGLLLLRTAMPPVSSVEGRIVRGLRRVGKRIVIGLDGELWLVLHLMIAGRLHWRELGARLAGRNSLAAFDFANGSLLLTEAGTKHRASLHVVSGEHDLRALDPGGIDVLACDVEAFRRVLTSENHTLKRALTDPRLLSGIGNAYSDEILHAAQLSPVLQTQKLDSEEWKRLYEATQETLRIWVERLRIEAEGGFPEKVTAFRKDMAVHGRFGLPCPRCAEKIQRIRYADNETNYCAKCQTGGRVLADRSLSRLLKADWPRTLEALEALKKK